MKLRYSEFRDGNFGDDLNRWLWPRLLPGLFDEDKRVMVLGIGSNLLPGTLLEARGSRYAVLGMGAGYAGMRFTLGRGFPWRLNSVGERLLQAPPLAADWVPGGSRLYWVRGPLTARLLNLDETLAMGDPVTLISRFFPAAEPRPAGIGYMPHHRSAATTRIRELCERVGYRFVDPRQPVEAVVAQIQACRVLITEALHGAIAADTLRVPWIPVRSTAFILPFKWADYAAVVGLSYRPVPIAPLWDVAGILRERRHPVPPRRRLLTRWRATCANRGNRERALEDLLAAGTVEPCLSEERVLARCRERMMEALGAFQADVAAGYWRAPGEPGA